MILRGIIRHVRKQEWTAIGIDFVIVIVGVFIGLQVNEWGAAQADERRGEVYIERLVSRLEQDLATQRGVIGYYDAVLASAERTNALLAERSPDPAELVINAYRATEYQYTRPRRAVWDEVVSRGDVGLLPVAAVDGGLGRYYSDGHAEIVLSTLGQSAYRRRVRSLIPHEVQRAIRERCSDVRDEREFIVGFSQDCDLNLSPAQIASAARALQEDPGVLRDLRYQFTDIGNARVNARRDIASIEGALAGLTED